MYYLIVLFAAALLIATTVLFLKCVVRDTRWWIYALFHYSFAWSIVSCASIEYGFYITELGMYSEMTGATFRFAFFHCVFLAAFFFGLKCLNAEASPRRAKPLALTGLLAVGLALGGPFIGNALSSPSGWSETLTRFNWWEHSRFPMLQIVVGTVCFPLSYILGTLFALEWRKQSVWWRIPIIVAFLYLLALVWMGQKYNGLIFPLFAFVLPALVLNRGQFIERLARHRLRVGELVKPAAAILVVLIVLGGIVWRWFDQNSLNAASGFSAFGNLLYRAVLLQAHSYYAADAGVLSGDLQPEEVLQVLLLSEGSGVHTVMHMVGDPALVQGYINRGVRFATIHPSLSIMLLGWVGTVFVQCFFGLAMALLAHRLRLSLRRGAVFLSFAYVNTIFSIFGGIFSMSEVSLFWNVKFLAPLLLALVLELIGKLARDAQPTPAGSPVLQEARLSHSGLGASR